MTPRSLALAGPLVLLLAGAVTAQAPAPTPAPPPPIPTPLSVGDIVLLLQMKVPQPRIEKFLDQAGVSFALDAGSGAEIMKAGGDRSLLGTIAISRRLPDEASTNSSPSR